MGNAWKCCKFLFKYTVSAFIGGLLAVWFVINFSFFQSEKTIHNSYNLTYHDLSYSDLASINLTAITVLLAVLGLLIAVAAIFGYYVIKDTLIKTTEEKVEKELPTMVETELKKMKENGSLERLVQKVLYEATQNNPDDEH